MTASTLTPLAVTTLALLNERPMHPYEMLQVLEERHEDRFVKIRQGSLYHSVARLVTDKLIEATGTEREGNRPPRTTYAITASGYDALVEQLRSWLSTPTREYPRFPVALGEAHNGPAELVVADLRRYAEALAAEVDELAGFLRIVTERRTPEQYWIALDYTHTVKRAELAWITTCIDRIESEDLPWSPPPIR